MYVDDDDDDETLNWRSLFSTTGRMAGEEEAEETDRYKSPADV